MHMQERIPNGKKYLRRLRRAGQEKQTDVWQRVDIVAKAIGSLLLPVVVFILGQRYTAQQRQFEEKRRHQEAVALADERKADRVALFLRHLAAENPSERLLAVKVLQHFASTKQFPSELLPAIIETVNDDNERVAKAASTTLTTAVKNDRRVAASVSAAVKVSPPARESVARAVTLEPELGKALIDPFSIISYPIHYQERVSLTITVENADHAASRVIGQGGILASGGIANLLLGSSPELHDRSVAITTVVTNETSKEFTVTYTFRNQAGSETSRTYTGNGVGTTTLQVVVTFDPLGP